MTASFTNQRLFDLVRYKRMELHTDGLVSDDEYAILAQEHAAVARLEDCDRVKARIASLTEVSARKDKQLIELDTESIKARQWKQAVMDALPDFQTMGAEMGLKPGELDSAKIPAYIRGLRERLRRVEDLAAKWKWAAKLESSIDVTKAQQAGWAQCAVELRAALADETPLKDEEAK